MDRIHYAGNTLTTGSAIAHAVLEYARALAAKSDSATVTIPVRHSDGSDGTAEFLIGPASQLVAEPYESAGPELEDDEVVARLNRAAAQLQGARPVPEATDYTAVDSSDLELPADALDN